MRAILALSFGIFISSSSISFLGLSLSIDITTGAIGLVEGPIGLCSRSTPSLLILSTNSRNASVPITLTISVISSLPKYILRSPLPSVCSGRILDLAVYGLNPTIVVTFCTSQPSLSINTETIALTGFSMLSMLFARLRSSFNSSSFFDEVASEISPFFLV